jgi:hypothetical protein
VSNCFYDELDSNITAEEIRIAIKKLKRNKSCGKDCIVNELFIDCESVLNDIFHSGFYPESWSESFITPVYKKGDTNDANKYRSISIVSCFGKMFTSIVNQRISSWEHTYSILSNWQFGF